MAEPNPNPPLVDSKTVARFWSKVNRNGPAHPTRPELGNCWMWTAGTFRGGYGQFSVYDDKVKRQVKAQRVSYYLETGIWPGVLVCHTCDRPGCCNPSHLFLGTTRDNVIDCKNKGRLNTAAGNKHGSRTQPWSMARGERVAGVKLTAEQVMLIRADYATGTVTQQKLADRHGVDRKAVSFIVNGVNWKHLPCDVGVMKQIAKANQARGHITS